MSIWELRKMNNSFSNVIDNNYQSIEHALKIIDALEREDSGILMLYLGNIDEGMSVIQSADSTIKRSMIEINKNATEQGESQIIENIEQEYRDYFSTLNTMIEERTNNEKIAYKELHNQFIDTKTEVNTLLELNQTSMYAKSTEMHNRLYQTMMPGIISIVLAIIIALLLNFFITRYFVNPLHILISATKNYKPPLPNINADIKSDDELKTLQLEINNLIRRILAYYKSK